MVEHQIKDFNQLIENPEKVNEKELTYFLETYKKISFLKFLFLYAYQNTSLSKRNWI